MVEQVQRGSKPEMAYAIRKSWITSVMPILLNFNLQFSANPQLAFEILQLYGDTRCPNHPSEILPFCGDSVPCIYDYTMLNSKILGMEAQNSWNIFTNERQLGTRQCIFPVIYEINSIITTNHYKSI